ncbi:MAG: AMP-binding protein, partial [Deltaproteobacteria bacterium]|nr:AMP-binding protein [Deltaproteobacteria bacterium]
PQGLAGDPKLKIKANLVKSTWDIIKTAKSKDDIWLSILAISWFWGMGSVILTQTPVMVDTIIGGTPAVATFMITTFALGVALGAILVQFFLKGSVSAKLVPGSSAILTVLFFFLTLSIVNVPKNTSPLNVGLGDFLTNWVYLRLGIFSFLISITAGFFVVPLNALIQHLAPVALRSRIIAANNIINALFMVIAALLVILFTTLGLEHGHIFLFLTFTSLLVTILTLYFLPDEVIKQIAKIIITILYSPEIKGLNHLKEFENKPVLVISNHVSFLDVALLVCYIPRKISFAINKTWAEHFWVKRLLRFFTAIPIDPNHPMATRSIIDALKANQLLVIFPEGRISVTGSIMKIYEGPGLIANHANVPIVPIIISDAEYSFFGRLKSILKNPPETFQVRMQVFPAFKLDSEPRENETRKDFRARNAQEIYETLVQCRFRTQRYQRNLYDALLEAALRYGPKRIIFEDASRKPITYGSLVTKSRILGRAFYSRLKNESAVAIALPNSTPLAITLFALWAAGKTAVILNFSQGKAAMSAALTASLSQTIITSRKFLESTKLTEQIEDLNSKILFLEDLNLNLWDKIRGFFWEPKPNSPTSSATVLFTSGSEGKPKGVLLSHQNILANITQALCTVDINEDDILFNAMPAFHTFGLNIGIILPLMRGIRTLNYHSPLHVKVIPELIYDSRATVILGTDTFAYSWGMNAHPYDFYKSRYFILGAEKVRPKTNELFYNKMGIRINEGYGVTEASPIVAVNSFLRYRSGSVGKLIPGIRYRLEKIPGISEGGKLLIKGPNIMLGYLYPDNPGIPESPPEGWYDTGDIVELDPEGFLFIKGRYKRFAKICGEMISLSSIEEIANKLWPDQTLAIVSIPDESRGERLILITTHQKPDLFALRDAIKQSGRTDFCVPKSFITFPEIPLTPMGKPNNLLLQKLAMEYFQNK